MGHDVRIVPHTHWDREWYAPFQSFRLRLVELLDDLLPRLQADASYTHFLLDGQMAAVDDYLEVRPGAEAALRQLTESGRVAVGPWYTLPDEFCVSGETLVRDLQLGLRRAEGFGGGMQLGYLPDMFGHVAQMPQLLRQFGFEHAVVWRGVPSAVNATGFWWEAPDGSTVRAEYLPDGYGNGAEHAANGAELRHMIETWVDKQNGLVGDRPVLWMNGTDHQVPDFRLPAVVAEANALGDGWQLRITSLADHVATAPTDGLPRWRGELRSGARANLLMGVASNRVDVKIAAARAERALERLAEPLWALFAPAHQWPEALLDTAWLEMIRNAAHDSSCACSDDEVCVAVLHRYAEARQIGEGLTGQALARVGAQAGARGPVVVNSTARARGGLIGVPTGAVGSHRSQPLGGGHALVRVDAVPGFGWQAFSELAPSTTAAVAVTDGGQLTNGLVTITVDPADGTFALDGHRGLGRLIDDGDAGDTYNVNPPDEQLTVDAPESVGVTVIERGPVRGRVQVDAVYRWPARVDEVEGRTARVGEVVVPVRTTIELDAGERFARVTVELTNAAEDHRLRAWFPLPEPAATSRAECAFAVVERGLTAEGGPTELGLPTSFSRRFVSAGGLTVAHEGLLEYELVDVADDGAHALALTLLRATRFLSRGPMAYRPWPAGPEIELPGAQVPGRHRLRYVVAAGEVDPYALADDAFTTLCVAHADGTGDGLSTHQALAVDGAEVSAVRRTRDRRLEVRVFNPTGAEVTVTIAGRTGHRVDLRGNAVEAFTGTATLGPAEIATFELDA